ncbi:DUF4215 domain-containing protein [Omnitrophica bacterium]|nr:DUF4215 domain-containing protein [Candidatus Omnitrophota bacterium]
MPKKWRIRPGMVAGLLVVLTGMAGLIIMPSILFSENKKDLQISPSILPLPSEDQFSYTPQENNPAPLAEVLEEELLEEDLLEEDSDNSNDNNSGGEEGSSCESLGGDSCVSAVECTNQGGSCIPGMAFSCDLGCCCNEADPEPLCPQGTTPCEEGCPDVACHDVISDPDGDGCCDCVAQCSTCPQDPSCPVVCGDGSVTGDEACDDGNTAGGDGCNENCELESCGNSNLDMGEQCDDGNTASGDGCSASCQIEECGNGSLDTGESCDDGNTSAGDGCDANCQIECGNGTQDSGESCDDGNTASGDGCDANCQLECGNGSQDPGEECDDGNTASGDGCDANCFIEPGCGNNLVEGAEQCDDGNTANGDGCDSACVAEVCGNGITQAGETCDDGNTVDGDGCDRFCEPEPVSVCPSGGTCVTDAQCTTVSGTEISSCGSGMVCCQAQSVFCQPDDLDGGWNTLMQSSGTVYLNGIPQNYSDACNSQTNLREYYCIGNSYDSRDIECDTNQLCLGGACTPVIVGECGDGVQDQWEDCDDGNTTNGDGCDSNCDWEQMLCLDDTDGGLALGVRGTMTVRREGQAPGADSRTFEDECRSASVLIEFVNEKTTCAYVIVCPPTIPCCFEGACTDQGCCGNGNVDEGIGEECETDADCNDEDKYCDKECMCKPRCGNGVIDGTEECDGAQNWTCEGGADCDTACNCKGYCGDGTKDEGEECDGSDAGECEGGDLGGCNKECQCKGYCGNNEVDSDTTPPEACDGTNTSACSDGEECEDCQCVVKCDVPGLSSCGDSSQCGSGYLCDSNCCFPKVDDCSTSCDQTDKKSECTDEWKKATDANEYRCICESVECAYDES